MQHELLCHRAAYCRLQFNPPGDYKGWERLFVRKGDAPLQASAAEFARAARPNLALSSVSGCSYGSARQNMSASADGREIPVC